MPPTLQDNIREYQSLLQVGNIQKAYKGIMDFMSGLRTYLGRNNILIT